MERAQGHTRRALLADPGGDQRLACLFGGVPIYMVNTRRTPSRPRPCHPRKLDDAMATSLRDCGFYSSSVRILVWPCFFFMCAASTPDIGPTAELPTHGCWLQQEKHGPTGDL